MIRISWIGSSAAPSYRDVLAIRRAANVHHGKLPVTVDDEYLADEFDCHAAIALLYLDEAPAGTVRMCLAPDSRPCDLVRFPGFLETASHCGGFGAFITGSRMAILPAFQGRGLFWMLNDVMPEQAGKVGRKFVIGGATGWVLEQYVKAGWERTGHVCADPEFGGLTHEFIVLDVVQWRRRRTESMKSQLLVGNYKP